MKCRLPALLFCLALCAAGPVRAQDDNGGGGDTGGDTGGITPAPGAGALGGGQSGASTAPSGGTAPAGNASDTGSGTITPTGPTDTGGPSSITPSPPVEPPSLLTPQPASTAASPPAGSNALTGGVLSAPAPVTLSLPGSYGEAARSFTLGQGQLSKPPILFSLSISQGYDDNIFSSASVPARKAVTAEVEVPQPAQHGVVAFRLTKVTLVPAIPAQEPVASALTTASLGVQIQRASPRTVFTMNGTLGALDYWRETKLQYTGGLGINLVHRLTPRATISASVDGVYQNQPDFSRINAPTANVSSSYVDADIRLNFSYGFTARFSTVLSYELGLATQDAAAGGNLYVSTYGSQFRYTVSPRNTATLELRQSQSSYASANGSDSTDTFLLVGLDSIVTARLRNTVSVGEELGSFNGGGSTALPYLESATSMQLPRGGVLSWTNRYGLENSNALNQNTSSFRTGLAISEPLGAKLGASLSIAYNYLQIKDRVANTATVNETQIEAGASLQYMLSPRLSLSLSYTFFDFLVSQPDSGYTRNQISLGAVYSF